jgi:hypothetical protein
MGEKRKKGNYIQVRVSAITRAALSQAGVPPGSLSRRLNEVAASLTKRQAVWFLGTEQLVADTSVPAAQRFDTVWVTPQPEMQARAANLGIPQQKLLRAAAVKLGQSQGTEA